MWRTIGIFLIWGILAAQNKVCGTDELWQLELQSDPEAYQRWLKFEEQLRAVMQNKANQKVQAALGGNSTIVIPVVVHVIYASNNPNDSISLDKVRDGIAVLNEDFRAIKGTMGGGGTDTKIEFALATKDPSGQPTTGVEYIYDPNWADIDNYTEGNAMKSATAWDPSKYLNVWLVNSITGSGGGTILGYAVFPFSADAGTTRDGIVMRKDTWGRIPPLLSGNQYGRTATHEVGHWVGLYHPFQGGCSNLLCNSYGDQVCDTPPQGDQIFSAGTRRNTCNTDFPDRPDPLRNYMGYASDAEIFRFTPGQVARLTSIMSTASTRTPIYSSANLNATGVGPNYTKPKTYIYTPETYICAGRTIQFYHYSLGQPNSWQWTFPGGTPSSSTQEFPTVTFNTPGTYTVELIVQNASGQKDTAQLQITVYDPATEAIAVDASNPYVEHFSCGWQNVPAKWQRYSGRQYIYTGNTNYDITCNPNEDVRGGSNAPASEKGALRFSGYNLGTYYGIHLTALSPLFDVSALKANNDSLYLTFYWAYAPLEYKTGNDYLLAYEDTLWVYISQDCGQTWQPIFYKPGNLLNTTGTYYNSAFSNVTPDLWQLFTYGISANDISGNYVQFKFEFGHGGGNQLYIDRFAVGNRIIVQQTKATPLQTFITLTPNPIEHQNATLTIKSVITDEAQISLYDLHGRLIWQHNTRIKPSTNTIMVPTQNLSKGIYVLKVSTSTREERIKVIKL